MAALPDRDKLLRNFSRCANWEEKYLYIIELGQRLAPLSPEEHTAQNIIQGCQSQVWIVMTQEQSGAIVLRGDSDAAIDPMSDPAVKAAVARATFEVLVGFQLDQSQLVYNVTR